MFQRNHSMVMTSIDLFIVVLLIFSGCCPYISILNPDHGPVGTSVQIKGGRFGATAAENTIKFGNVAVPISDISVVSTSEIIAKVPTGATTALVSVSTSKGTGKSKDNFKVIIPGGAKWTMMVYLDADNNLESAGITDFIEMSSVGSNNDVNIIVQMDRINGYNAGYGDWTGTRRFRIMSGDTPSSTPIQDINEQNMGDPKVLQDFIEWAITNYPAEHYALSIWNHGDGWRKSMERMETISRLKRAGPEEVLVKAVASDNTDNDILYMREVQDALNGARLNIASRSNTNVKIDVVGFDACLMGMVEVAYALRSHINYMVGSEELEPGNGWPYNLILADLKNNPTMSAADMAKSVVTNYGSIYPSGVTQAAYDISHLEELAVKVDTFVKVANTNWAALKTARSNSRQYHPSWSSSCWGTDLWDFADKAYNYCTSSSIKYAASELKTSIDNLVIEEFHSPDMAGSHGVAIYFPPNLSSFNNDPQHTGYEQSNTFMTVDFVKVHQFDEWLQDYYSNIP